MRTITGVQRYNSRMDKIWERYKAHEQANENFLPPITKYSDNLQRACRKFNITIETARTKYGLFTNKQWNELLTIETT